MTTDELLLYHVDGYDYRREHERGFNVGLAFAEDGVPQDGQRAQEIQVVFSNFKTGVFTYDAQRGLYLVSQYDAPHMDGVSETQLAVTNVLVLFADFSVMDGEGRLDVDFSQGGSGYFASGGQIIAINWAKPRDTAPFVFTLENGQPLVLGEGRSYINIVNENTGSVNFS